MASSEAIHARIGLIHMTQTTVRMRMMMMMMMMMMKKMTTKV
jgi:hypothetical protein